MKRSSFGFMIAITIIAVPAISVCGWVLPIHNHSNAQIDVHLFFNDPSECDASFYLSPKRSKKFGVDGDCKLGRVELRSGGRTVIAALDIDVTQGNPSEGIIITQNPSGTFTIARAVR